MTGPIDGTAYAGGVMVPFSTESDEWVAAMASYVRTNLTNNSFTVTPEMVAKVRAANSGRTTPWTHAELVASCRRFCRSRRPGRRRPVIARPAGSA